MNKSFKKFFSKTPSVLKRSIVAMLCGLLCLSTMAKAQEFGNRIDSIQFIVATNDSLEFIVHSSVDIDVREYHVESLLTD